MTVEELNEALPYLDVKEEIGAGGMGIVFKVYNQKTDRIEALKTLRPGSKDIIREERFEREALMSLKQHPNIVQVYEYHSKSEFGSPYFTMEYVNGTSLDERIDKGRLSRCDRLEGSCSNPYAGGGSCFGGEISRLVAMGKR